ncbi:MULTISPECIES: hypothetical protein [Aliarcobacter]|nr:MULTISPECIES: hypothetical protein [Aliarcobacter]MCT7494022.1 hypothetical protein [Aliarcobacter cryaerophilus]
MYFNYLTYYKNENENEYETLTDKEILKQVYKRNKEFYKTDTYKRFFL